MTEIDRAEREIRAELDPHVTIRREGSCLRFSNGVAPDVVVNLRHRAYARDGGRWFGSGLTYAGAGWALALGLDAYHWLRSAA